MEICWTKIGVVSIESEFPSLAQTSLPGELPASNPTMNDDDFGRVIVIWQETATDAFVMYE